MGKKQRARTRQAEAPRLEARSSPRYAPPKRGIFRPAWHNAVGTTILLIGISLFIVNDLDLMGLHWMPGGHQEVWAAAAFGIAVSSAWWFGWFDQTTGS